MAPVLSSTKISTSETTPAEVYHGWSNWKSMAPPPAPTVMGKVVATPPLGSKFMNRPVPRPVTVVVTPRNGDWKPPLAWFCAELKYVTPWFCVTSVTACATMPSWNIGSVA